MAIPIPALVWNYIITSANNAFRVTYIHAASPVTVDSTLLASATAYTTHKEIETILQQRMLLVLPGVTVVVSADGYVTIAFSHTDYDNATTLTLAWSHSAATIALGTLLGFGVNDVSATVSGHAASFTATSQITQFWTPGLAAQSDSGGAAGGAETLYARAVVRTAGGQNKTTNFHALTERTVKFGWLPASRVWIASEGTPKNTAIEWFLGITSAGPSKFRYIPDRTLPTTGAVDYFLLPEAAAAAFRPERLSPSLAVYALTLRMGAYTA